MLVSTQTEYFGSRFGDATAIKMINTAGFDAYDFSMFRMSGDEPDEPLNAENYLEYAKGLRELADSLGIVCNQAHAPFPSTKGDAAWDERQFGKIVRSMEIAAVLGAPTIVVHPCHHLPFASHAEELKAINLDFYKRLIPYCEKYGIKVATENMWQVDMEDGLRIVDSTCSQAEEFCEYVDMLDSPWIVGCLDIGHVPLVGEDMAKIIEILGGRIKALHVHDNNLRADNHTLPFVMDINFETVIASLKKVGYSGDMTFEADNFLRKFPDELLADAAAFMCRVGRYIASRLS